MINILLTAVFMALVFSFFVITFEKIGFLDYLRLTAPNDFTYKLLTCNFCIGFWLSVFFFGVITAVFQEPANLICIFLTPVLVRLLT